MNKTSGKRRNLFHPNALLQAAYFLLFLGFAVYLFFRCQPRLSYTEERFVFDLIWLDAWSIAFVAALVVVWNGRIFARFRIRALLILLSLYGLVTTNLILANTPFPPNAFWGDQQFRQAMILKFTAFALPMDFYYKDLPVFYPPLYYFLLSLYSRVFSVETFKMLKTGGLLIYAVGPFLLYWLWRKLVTPLQAFCVAAATYVVSSYGVSLPLVAPHAFLADSFFIPWWLCYIEQVGNYPRRLKDIVVGAIIGGLLFMTYFYPFFIGGFLLIVRATVLSRWRIPWETRRFRPGKALVVLTGAAVVSAPYWLPLFMFLAEYGIDRSRGGWFHAGSTGYNFLFTQFSFPGLLFLAALLMSAGLWRSPIHRRLLYMTGAVVLFTGAASVLGATGLSLNTPKVLQFVVVIGGSFIGLGAATLVRWSGMHRKKRPLVAVVLLLVLLILLGGVSDFAKHGQVKRAREANIPHWNIDPEIVRELKGKVVLSGHPALYSFYPAYSFFSTNEHYSHPASRYISRYNFLYRLQDITDPLIFNLALAGNRFDRIDYFMPARKDESFLLFANVSNYPDRFTSRTFAYPSDLVGDTNLFRNMAGDHLYEVATPSPGNYFRKYVHAGDMTVNDSLLDLAKIRTIQSSLSESANDRIDRHINADWSNWESLTPTSSKEEDGREVELLSAHAVTIRDSIYFLFEFQPQEKIPQDFRVFFHVYPKSSPRFDNYDFTPGRPTTTWEKLDIVWCVRAVPRYDTELLIHFGFFKGNERYAPGYWRVYASDK